MEKERIRDESPRNGKGEDLVSAGEEVGFEGGKRVPHKSKGLCIGPRMLVLASSMGLAVYGLLTVLYLSAAGLC